MSSTPDVCADTQRRFERWFVASVLVPNIALYVGAAANRSMLGFYVCTIYGPILNGVFLIAGVFAAIFLKRRMKEFKLLREFTLAVVVPVLTTGTFGSLVLWYIRGR